MKRNRAVLTVLSVVLVLMLSALLSGCNEAQKRILQRLMATESGQYAGEEVDEERIAELKDHIKRFSDEVEQLVEDTGQLGIFYKMLALEFMDEKQYGPAREYFLKSLEIYPNNQVVQYYTGLVSAQTAGAQPTEAERRARLEEAAYHYERAAELKRNYFEALYALAVLYIHELDRPFEAEQYVQRALEVRPGSDKTKFLLASIRVQQGRFEEAVEIYDEIAAETEDENMRARARENREQILGGGYDG
ncbi:MAG: tetratricopeptide repeat protein [Spirochaetia bacterium]